MHLLAQIQWDVSPILFDAGPFQVRWYGLLFALGFLVGYFIVRRMFIREEKPIEDLEPLLFYLLGGAIIGARLGHVLFYNAEYYFLNPVEILYVHQGGLASHGGGIGLIVAFYLYSRSRKDQPFLWVADRVFVPTALAGMFIRLGNLFNSELFGEEATVPWAFVFERIDSIPRHPVQLYESLSYGLIFVVLYLVYHKYGRDTPHGLLSGLFLILIFSARFVLEFFKAPVSGPILGPLDMGQVLSIPAVLLGVWLVWRSRRADLQTKST